MNEIITFDWILVTVFYSSHKNRYKLTIFCYFTGDFRISRILDVHHPWEHYLRYVFSQTSSNKLLYEQLIGRRTEFLSMAADGSFLEMEDVYTGLAADEKLMLETTLQLVREGGPTTLPPL